MLASVAGLIALAVRFGEDSTRTYWLLTLLFPLGFVASVAVARGYEQRFLGSGSEEYRRVTDAGVRYLALAAFAAYGLKYEVARGYVLLAFPLGIALLLVGRYAARQWLHRMRRQGRLSHKVLVLGRERSAAELIRQLKLESHAGFDVVGACIDGSDVDAVEGVPVLGSAVHDVIEALEACGADTVAVGAVSFQVLHCPGHTPGHIVFLQAEAGFALVGDVLFRGSVGRTDFPYGDGGTLLRSIRDKLMPLDDRTAFLCGHGPGSTIGLERNSNPFVRQALTLPP